MAGKAKFDQEAAFKSIIGAGVSEGSEKPVAKGRPKAEWETKKPIKKRVSIGTRVAQQRFGQIRTGIFVSNMKAANGGTTTIKESGGR